MKAVPVHAALGKAARLPAKQPAVAGAGKQLQASISIGITDGGRGCEPASSELGKARRLFAALVPGMQEIARRARDDFLFPVAVDIHDDGIYKEGVVLDGAREADFLFAGF